MASVPWRSPDLLLHTDSCVDMALAFPDAIAAIRRSERLAGAPLQVITLQTVSLVHDTIALPCWLCHSMSCYYTLLMLRACHRAHSVKP